VHNGPAIWRAERKEIAWQAILAMEPACRDGMLPDAIPAKVGFLNWAVICHWPEKEGMAHFLPSLSLRSFSEGGQVQILLSIRRVAVQF